jgi:hypothetical protein
VSNTLYLYLHKFSHLSTLTTKKISTELQIKKKENEKRKPDRERKKGKKHRFHTKLNTEAASKGEIELLLVKMVMP